MGGQKGNCMHVYNQYIGEGMCVIDRLVVKIELKQANNCGQLGN